MSLFKDLLRGKKKEEREERVPGKTYREGALKKRTRIRQTSVSSGTYSITKIALNLLVTIAVIGIVGAIGYFVVDLVFNW